MEDATVSGRKAVDIDRVVWDPAYRQRVITNLNCKPKRQGCGASEAPRPNRGRTSADSASIPSPTEDSASRS